ncbi:MAG: LysM peptidoglycan-binding domain-containing protein [Desulfobacteraceae bacterium]|nr:LysM peptidoglycan-binding domain-containing protein [Desulfobacteraceae bacterium]MBU4054313.1 LysM peptidoglycan-binding domain-containing protein [Pseudomonadota bacterium]
MNDKKPDNLDEYEEEIDDEEFKKPMHEFDDDIEYLDEEKRNSKSLRPKKFSFPRFSIGWLGGLLVLLVLLFLILPKGEKKSNNDELIVVKSRVEELERRQQDVEALNQRMEKLEGEALSGTPMNDRMDQLEKLLISKTGEMKRDVDALKIRMEKEKTAKVVEKPQVEAPLPKIVQQPAKKPVKASSVKYHTVQKGENLFRIALKYNLKENELLNLNDLSKGAKIFPGQRLRVSK